ncbi:MULTISPECIES: cytochrome c oxidase subunit 3 [unclassified Coleofasciculus]|uniref:cytochrome c oxidase subunit 3 n=1 Tax=unclassified Coleofasciculus TaxID=2692782 RepID=UPI0018818FCF|nr:MULTISPECIES: heme-copper oxidase subunit III [unclassified Coleofasciculus]MBE9124848.1 heme-copper oxidase subunit III [Coleofasciculus sp. LEGE 07081]MBE9147753.1 heme-copper oxidase subunit III [Coleofasciculus sp. LEGE 07092]
MQGSTLDEYQVMPSPEATTDGAVAHHEEHPDLRVLGLLIFLASESLMFGGMFAAYLIYRGAAGAWPPEGTEVELWLPTINTIILVSSSFVIHQGDVAIKKNNISGMRLWYLVTAIMGVIFLGGQVYEYLTLGYGIGTNVFSSCFYLMTGFHGLHVTVGVLLILGVLWRSRRSGHYGATKHVGIEMAEIYWHFVDIIWIVLFSLLYILTLF